MRGPHGMPGDHAGAAKEGESERAHKGALHLGGASANRGWSLPARGAEPPGGLARRGGCPGSDRDVLIMPEGADTFHRSGVQLPRMSPASSSSAPAASSSAPRVIASHAAARSRRASSKPAEMAKRT